MVDIIWRAFTVIEADKFFDNFDEIRNLEDAMCIVIFSRKIESSVHLVTRNRTHVVFLEIEEKTIDKLFCVLRGCEITRTNFAIDTLVRLLDGAHCIAIECCLDVILIRLHNVFECLEDLTIGSKAEYTKKLRNRNLALAINLTCKNTTTICLKLHPYTALWDNFCSMVFWEFRHRREEHTRRTYELTDDDTLDTANDECSTICHKWNRTEEYILFLDFTCLFVDELNMRLHC